MVISFEEKDRIKIESRGMTVIEFKRKLYEMGKTIDDVWQVLNVCVIKTTEAVVKAWNAVVEAILEAVDNVIMAIEVVKDICHIPTSHRYRLVKIFSKCTGMDIRFGWKISWMINRWYTRCCRVCK